MRSYGASPSIFRLADAVAFVLTGSMATAMHEKHRGLLIGPEPNPRPGGEMSENSNAAVIRRLYDECLNHDRFEILAELVGDDVVQHFGQSSSKGLEAFESNARRVRAMFPDGRFTVDGVVSNGSEAAAHWTMTGTHSAPIAGIAPTGKPITNHGVVFYRFAHGKIAEIWLEVDQVGVFRQIGVSLPGAPAAQAPATA
jgi:predicted ester cyclase